MVVAAEGRRRLRRPMRRQQESVAPKYKSKGTMGLVPPGTKGIYDTNPKVRSATARAMVARRQMIEVTCEVPHCTMDTVTGGPKTFLSRLVDGRPERRGCCSAHRLWLWRKDMKDQGYKQVTVDGEIGWLTPEGVFYPNPSQPKSRKTVVIGGRRVRSMQRPKKKRVEVTPESG
jgi:hypothetical protein